MILIAVLTVMTMMLMMALGCRMVGYTGSSSARWAGVGFRVLACGGPFKGLQGLDCILAFSVDMTILKLRGCGD